MVPGFQQQQLKERCAAATSSSVLLVKQRHAIDSGGSDNGALFRWCSGMTTGFVMAATQFSPGTTVLILCANGRRQMHWMRRVKEQITDTGTIEFESRDLLRTQLGTWHILNTNDPETMRGVGEAVHVTIIDRGVDWSASRSLTLSLVALGSALIVRIAPDEQAKEAEFRAVLECETLYY